MKTEEEIRRLLKAFEAVRADPVSAVRATFDDISLDVDVPLAEQKLSTAIRTLRWVLGEGRKS